ncbi:hypothetical protein GCM10022209_07180 [Chitinophaga oryziterrae]
MYTRKITIGNTIVYLASLPGTNLVRARIKGDMYYVHREKNAVTKFVIPSDLPIELQERIIWAVDNYFRLRK